MKSNEELRSLIIQVLNVFRSPLSTKKIAEAILQINQDVVPQPIYDPYKTYQKGQRLYHTSSKCQGWFVVQAVQGDRLFAQFDNGQRMKLIHGGGLKQHPEFPVTDKAYLAEKVERLLPSIPGIYQQDGLWLKRPIRQESIPEYQLDKLTEMRGQLSTLMPRPPVTYPASTSHTHPVIVQQMLEVVLQEYQIRCFYHITHVENLVGILKVGLLCRSKIKEYHDISNLEIQNHRHYKHIPCYPKLTLHKCVPLFVAPKPPMLSALREQQPEIIYLHIAPKILILPQAVFTDGNARNNATRFYSRLVDFKNLDWKILRMHYWGSDDPIKHTENKRRRSAEVLIPNCIPSSYIQCITVMSPDTQRRVLNIIKEAKKEIRVIINSNMYYPITNLNFKEN